MHPDWQWDTSFWPSCSTLLEGTPAEHCLATLLSETLVRHLEATPGDFYAASGGRGIPRAAAQLTIVKYKNAGKVPALKQETLKY